MFRLLPNFPLFAAILLLLPNPNHFTLADLQYTGTLRMWLGVIAVCLLALRSSGDPVRTATTFPLTLGNDLNAPRTV